MNDAVATELELLRGIFYDDGLLIEERSSKEEEEDGGGENEGKEASFCPSGIIIAFLFHSPHFSS
eukprot:evm.model.NODE_15857_length_2193_cov_11.645235.1